MKEGTEVVLKRGKKGGPTTFLCGTSGTVDCLACHIIVTASATRARAFAGLEWEQHYQHF